MDKKKTKRTQNARRGRPTKAGYTTQDKFKCSVPFCGLVTRSDNLRNQQLEHQLKYYVVYNCVLTVFTARKCCKKCRKTSKKLDP